MTKSLNATWTTHLSADVHTLFLAMQIIRTDGTQIFLVDHDEDINFAAATWRADLGFTASVIKQSSDLSVDNLTIEGLIDGSTITIDDIYMGKFDYAAVILYASNFKDPSQNVILKRGWIGEITINDDKWVAEVRGLTQALQQNIVDVYTAECKAALGDSACGITLATYTVTGTVTASTNRTTFSDSSRSEADAYFNHGKLTWTNGPNDDLSMEVKDFIGSSGQFTCFMPMWNNINVGHTYSVYAGCDKKWATCKNKFNNLVNFRGFPFVPTQGDVLKIEGL